MSVDPPTLELALTQQGWLRALVRGLLRDDEVEDVVQETWLSALARPPRSSGGLRPWLTRVARNHALARLRADASRRRREEAVARPEAMCSTDEIVEQVSLQRAVVDAVLHLEEPYRSVVLLRFWKDLPPREIAQRLRVPGATVRTRLRRGLELLRQKLDREHGGRRAWSAGLAPLAGGMGASAGAIAFPGALLMSLKLKLGVAAAVAVAAAVFFWAPFPEPAIGQGAQEETAVGARPVATQEHGEAALASRALVDSRPLRTSGPAPLVVGKLTDEITGAPVREAAVTFLHMGPRDAARELATRSGPDGGFRIEADYTKPDFFREFLVEAPDYAPWFRSFTLEPPTTKTAGGVLDLGTIAVPRGAKVFGQVVAAEDRSAVHAARLFLLEERYGHFKETWFAYGRPMGSSGADGSFVLPERVAPTGAFGQIWGHLLVAVSDRGIGCLALHVIPRRDEVRDAVILVEPTCELAVAVRDPEGRPIAGAQVRAKPRFEPFFERYREDPSEGPWQRGETTLVSLFTAVTDATGSVTFPRLPRPGRGVPGPDRGARYTLIAGAAGFLVARSKEVLAGSSREPVVLTLARHEAAVVAGSVKDTSGSPVPDALVRCGAVETRTDALGRFSLTEKANGWHGRAEIRVEAAGYAPVTELLQPPYSKERSKDFVLERVTRAPIRGRVRDEAGQPVAGVSLSLSKATRGLYLDGGHTGSDGTFVFSEATTGEWRMEVRAPAGFEGPMEAPRVRGGDQDVQIVVTRKPVGGAQLIAEIVDAKTGAPLDPIRASVMRRMDFISGSGIPSAETSRLPGKVLANGLQPGVWRITVEFTGRPQVEQTFTVQENEPEVRLRVVVGAAGVLTGRVVLDGVRGRTKQKSLPLGLIPNTAGVWYTAPGVRGGGAGGYAPADLQADGGFRFEEVLTERPIRVFLFGEDMIIGEATVTVPSGGEAHVEIKAELGGEVVFRMPADPDYEIANVSVRRSDGSWLESGYIQLRRGEKGASTSKQRLRAGETAWRATLHPEAVFGRRGSPREVEGKVLVVAGSSVDVVVQ